MLDKNDFSVSDSPEKIRAEEEEIAAEIMDEDIPSEYLDCLTPRQRKLVEEFFIDFNKAKAFVRAGYSPTGVTNNWFHRVFANPKIKKAIEIGMRERQKRLEATSDAVIANLARIAFCDVTQVVRIEDGEMFIRDTDEIPYDCKMAITKISQTMNAKGHRSVKIDFASKSKALELLARHLGLLSEDGPGRGRAGNGEKDPYYDAVTRRMAEDPKFRNEFANLMAGAACGELEGRAKE